MRVAVYEAIGKTDGNVFRCTLSGLDSYRWLEVPAWMFERAACPNQSRQCFLFDLTDYRSGVVDVRRIEAVMCPSSSGFGHVLLFARPVGAVERCLHRGFAETPPSLMGSLLVIESEPFVQVLLQGFRGLVKLFAKRHAVELIEHGFWNRSQIPLVCGLFILVPVWSMFSTAR
jgi:hypothetical protein